MLLLFLPLICICWQFTSRSLWTNSTLKIVDAKHARLHNSFKNTKCKLLRTNATIWFNKMCRIKEVKLNYINIRDSSQADHQQTRTPNTHRWHTHAATYCVIIQTQRTQINGRNSNGTKQSGGPPEDGREKRPEHVGVLYLQTRFWHFIGFKCWSDCVLKCE